VALGTLGRLAGRMCVLLFLFFLAAIGANMLGLLFRGGSARCRFLGIDQMTPLLGAETAIAIVALRLPLTRLHPIVKLLEGYLDLGLVGQLFAAGEAIESGIGFGRFPGSMNPNTLIVVGGSALVIVGQVHFGFVVEGLEAPFDNGVGQMGFDFVHQRLLTQFVEQILLPQSLFRSGVYAIAHLIVVQEGIGDYIHR